jgi:hypothetical protein
MPAMNMNQEFDMTTRDRNTKVKVDMAVNVSGPELPNMDIVGAALEKCIELMRTEVAASYLKVPQRPGETEVAKPYEVKV